VRVSRSARLGAELGAGQHQSGGGAQNSMATLVFGFSVVEQIHISSYHRTIQSRTIQ
jgi:hypothetical protein